MEIFCVPYSYGGHSTMWPLGGDQNHLLQNPTFLDVSLKRQKTYTIQTWPL